MLRFHFFTAKQGTWVHKDDRGPFFSDQMHVHEKLDFEFNTLSMLCSFIGAALSQQSQNTTYSEGPWAHRTTESNTLIG